MTFDELEMLLAPYLLPALACRSSIKYSASYWLRVRCLGQSNEAIYVARLMRSPSPSLFDLNE